MQMVAEDGKIPTAADVLGTIGTALWSIQLIPQIWYNWTKKNTEGLPASMMFIWALSAVCLGIYLVLEQVNIPLQIQPQMFGALCAICWAQVLYYSHGYTSGEAIVAGVMSAAFLGGSETLFIVTFQVPYNKGVTWPAILFGVLAMVFIIIGLIPIYNELWKRQGRVVGISWIFLSMDALGALFSLLALAVEGTFSIIGGTAYILVLVLELGIFISHIIWKLRFWELCQAAKAHGMSFDEFMRLERNGGNNNSSSISSNNSSSAHCELRCSPDDCTRKSPPPYAVPNVNLEGRVSGGEASVDGKVC
ncbi:PQ loop repeat protein [Histoplasma capsulatum G186AR]|uniref:PQ loop repeat protein n=1 Tax=Ajellomyces capsulatus TaxID=5037 RepID=A0A8H7Z6R6_AJECA|nr:PQ loop repeat protein [Histoplasma capsulatum]QSS75961.1 PQ loop repeat protein [Histoplasma capsulatum G186AR]